MEEEGKAEKEKQRQQTCSLRCIDVDFVRILRPPQPLKSADRVTLSTSGPERTSLSAAHGEGHSGSKAGES